ncbi:ferredoxin [Kitasatospora sp. NPDC054939]
MDDRNHGGSHEGNHDADHDGLPGYWDPLPTARQLLAEEPSLDQFGGLWEERNWRNVPGPFYGADTDSMQMGRHDAPFHLAYDDDHGPLSGREFVYRQPADPAQTEDLLNGCVFGHGGFAMDGDDHWSVPAVREWWQERGRVREWAVTAEARWSRVDGTYRGHYRDAAQGLRDYIAHLDHGLEEYLRGYLFWLDERRPHRAGEPLPLLDGRPRRGAPAPPLATAAAPVPGDSI